MTLTIGSIQVLEKLTINTSQATGNKDAVEIYFKVTNAGSGAHTVSLRTQLDTLLGTNDGAPFRIPRVGEVTKDLEFDNDPTTTAIGDIPAQALVMDNLASPNIIALLTFTDLGYIKPDRVVFGYWPDSVSKWDYTVDPSKSFLDHNGDGTISGVSPDSDSSVIVWWGYPAANAFTLPSGGSKEFALLYGIGNCSSLSASPLSVLFCAPAVLQGNVLGASFAYSPVNLTAFISNNSNAAVTRGAATLNFTPDLQLASGYTKARPIEGTSGSGTLAAGKNTQIDWQILSKGRHLDARPISLSIDSDGKHSSVVRNVTVQTIAGLLYGQATDENGNPVAGASITVLCGGAAVASAATQSDGTYSVQGLAPGTYDLRMSVAGRPDGYLTASVAGGTSSAVSGNPSSFGAGTNLQSFAYPNPARSGKAHISFFTSGAASCDIELFTASGELIRKIPYSASGAGWHSVDWDIDGVANGVYLYQITAGGGRSRGRVAVLKRRGI